ncbi:MAG: tRNA threonylcarbamoyladenosine dehydratase [Muribaculaceae bacterium]|nr:tRNA threonylcarbamoyladenosine dehydratase [Muribaculaceae bacterium]
MRESLGRTRLLAGDDMLARMAETRVIVFGTGGVGSWCVEALARTGIGHITIVDSDTVAESNINRQLPALFTTIGRPKVEVLAERIRAINPDADVTALEARYTPENAESFALESYDYVIDAIDSLPDKADLILRCTNPATAPLKAFFSSMGAARKMDIGKVQTAEFRKVEGCALARSLRNRFRKTGVYPRRKFRCVYSPERLEHRYSDDSGANGTFVHATAVFGLRLAELVIKDIYLQG